MSMPLPERSHAVNGSVGCSGTTTDGLRELPGNRASVIPVAVTVRDNVSRRHFHRLWSLFLIDTRLRGWSISAANT